MRFTRLLEAAKAGNVRPETVEWRLAQIPDLETKWADLESKLGRPLNGYGEFLSHFESKRPAGAAPSDYTGGLHLPTLIAERDKNVARLESELASARGESLAAFALAEGLEKELTEARTRIATLESAERSTALGLKISQLADELDQERGRHAIAQRNLALLEGLCGVKGIDRAAAIPASESPVEKPTIAELDAEMKAANGNPAKERAVVARVERFYGPPAATGR